MFTHPPTLHLRSPSPTTTEFIVTNQPPPCLSRTLSTALLVALRLLVASATILLLLSHHSLLPPSPLTTLPPIPTHILYPTAFILLYLTTRQGYTEESLLVIRSLGVQISTTSGSLLGGGRKTRFIPTQKVRDVFIHEGFWGMEVRFYLAVVVEGEGELVVVFPKLLPNRKILEKVWRGARKGLYQPRAIQTRVEENRKG